jgi:hypothetical protein
VFKEIYPRNRLPRHLCKIISGLIYQVVCLGGGGGGGGEKIGKLWKKRAYIQHHHIN